MEVSGERIESLAVVRTVELLDREPDVLVEESSLDLVQVLEEVVLHGDV